MKNQNLAGMQKKKKMKCLIQKRIIYWLPTWLQMIQSDFRISDLIMIKIAKLFIGFYYIYSKKNFFLIKYLYTYIYSYELQIESNMRKIGLGKFIMHFLETLCERH